MGQDWLPLSLRPSSATLSDSQICRIPHRQTLPVPDMLQGEIWLEIIVLTDIICLSITHTPVLVVAASIFPDFLQAEPLRALVMTLRRTECGKKQSMFLADTLADIQHI